AHPFLPSFPTRRSSDLDFFGETEIPHGLIDFLESGPPPIVFTLGSTAIWVANNFYRDSIEAARVLGRRALVLIGHALNMPPLPRSEEHTSELQSLRHLV